MRPRCPHCGFKCCRVRDIGERYIRDLEGFGPVYGVGVDPAAHGL